MVNLLYNVSFFRYFLLSFIGLLHLKVGLGNYANVLPFGKSASVYICQDIVYRDVSFAFITSAVFSVFFNSLPLLHMLALFFVFQSFAFITSAVFSVCFR